MFSSLMPQRKEFFDLMTAHSDRVVAAANATLRLGMYHIADSTPESRELAALAADACLRLNRAVISLGDKERAREAITLCREIESIETKADKVLRKAVTRLFADDSQMWKAIRLREFYFLQESVLDQYQATARTIEEILIENA